jgi:putative transposase
MPKGLKRYYGQGHLHFLTFSCYRRLPLLGTARARNAFIAALRTIRDRYHFLLVGYVVMPEHVHLLISENAKMHAIARAESVEAACFPGSQKAETPNANGTNASGI